MNRNLKSVTKLAGRLKRWHYIVASIVLAGLVAVVVFFSLFSLVLVGSPSMEPTLLTGDRALVRHFGVTPHRGDIVTFSPPKDLPSGYPWIKRVIGLPGDRVVISDGIITIYNEQYPDGFVPSFDLDTPLPELPADEPFIDRLVGAEEVFVVGDNRNPGGSRDSRDASHGNVPLENLQGIVIFAW